MLLSICIYAKIDKYMSIFIKQDTIYKSHLPQKISIPIFIENVNNEVYGCTFTFYYPSNYVKKDSIKIQFYPKLNIKPSEDKLGMYHFYENEGKISFLVTGIRKNYFINNNDTLAKLSINLDTTLKHQDLLAFGIESTMDSYSIDTLGEKSLIYGYQNALITIIDSVEIFKETVKNSTFVQKDNIRIAIMPNPNNGSFYIQFDESIYKVISHIEILDRDGNKWLQIIPKHNPEYVQIPNPITGIYLISIYLNTGKLITLKIPVIIE